MFSIGQKGIIRVAKDTRKDRAIQLSPGIYAIVEVEGLPHLREKDDNFWNKKPDNFHDRLIVDLLISKNLLHQPVLIKDLKNNPDFDDKYIMNSGYGGFSSYPISKQSYEIIMSMIE